MIVGAMIVGVAGALLSGGTALAAGKPLLTVAGCYMAGGSVSMLLTLVLGARSAPPSGPRHARPAPASARRVSGPVSLAVSG